MLTKSKTHNPNYLCKIVKLQGLQKHSNADRLQTVSIDFQTVITGMNAREGDLYVFFPVESAINEDLLSFTNSFRDSALNIDKEAKGFFETNCRVKAMRLRGEKSMGYIIPLKTFSDWCSVPYDILEDYVDEEFDVIENKLVLKKYEVKKREANTSSKQGKKPKVSRLVDGQVHLHVDTENLRRNAHKIHPEDLVSITYKTHGTSWWVSNVLVKKKLNWMERVVKFFGFDVKDEEYDLVYGSRRVVKNADMDDPKKKDHYFGYDLWKKIKEEVGAKIPKGYTLYGEMLGYNHNGGYIQKGFDYGCEVGEHKLEVYRITHTTPDGLVTELSYPEIDEFCSKVGLIPSHLFFYGQAMNIFPELNVDEHWNENLVKRLEEAFNEKDCFMCNNEVPEEGIVLRKESLFDCESYKLKSFKFLEWESKDLDNQEETGIEHYA